MELNKTVLQQKLDSLKQQFEQIKNNASATNGAIQMLEHLLQELEKPVVDVKNLIEK